MHEVALKLHCISALAGARRHGSVAGCGGGCRCHVVAQHQQGEKTGVQGGEHKERARVGTGKLPPRAT